MRVSVLAPSAPTAPSEIARHVVELERVGLDLVWVGEPYGFDAPTTLGYLAAQTTTVQVGAGILPIYTRTPSLVAMTAAGLDWISGGRAVLGLGTSGPQVIEGFHGVPFDRPVARTREVIEICRGVWRREQPLVHEGSAYQVPLPASHGTALGKPLKLLTKPVRPEIPIYVAALGEKNVELAAEVADGWNPLFFSPARARETWGKPLEAGATRRDAVLGPLEICAGGLVAIGDDAAARPDLARPHVALYVGGMGARGHNFYNELFARYGYEREAHEIQEHFLEGRRHDAEAAIPEAFLEEVTLCGSRAYVKDRLAEYEEAGVTILNADLAGPNPVGTLAELKALLCSALQVGMPASVPPPEERGSLNTAHVLDLYRQMLRIRLFEEEAAVLYRDGKIPGFVHLSVGQEAVPVGVCASLRRDDVITSTHRGHGHVLAKGLDMTGAFAELFGMEQGSCGGRGGSMHIADPSLGIFGANGIVGAGVPIAAGAATAAALRGDGKVAVAFFGEGAMSTGAFHEAATLAGAWALPLVLLCENNQFFEFTPTSDHHGPPIEHRARAYDVAYRRVDGNDVEDVATTMRQVVENVRGGSGPAFVEAVTFRVRGHYEGDAQRYRDAEFDRSWLDRDPIKRTATALAARGVEEGQLATIEAAVRAEVATAVEVAASGRRPAAETLFAYVGPPIDQTAETPLPPAEPAKTSRTIRAALHDALADDPEVFVAGIDVGAGGNVFGLTRGLLEAFPRRVLDTPIAETAILGMGVGAAMAGMRPVVEIMYSDFLLVCLDQVVNQAAKLGFMTGGKVRLPLTIRTQFGAGRSSGAQHSQSLEAMLAHIPGLVVVMPSTPADAYGLLRAAIRHDGPVLVIEHRLLYEKSGPGFAAGHHVPIGQAKILRPGTQVTIVSYSRMVQSCLEAADRLAGEGIDAEVVDLRTIAPLDWDTVLTSVAKTSRLVVAHEATVNFGVGAEIAARAAGEGFWTLDAPVVRVGAPFTPAPYSPSLEEIWVPGVDDVIEGVRRVLAT